MGKRARSLKYSAINGAISANKFYGKARAAYKVGRAVYDKYKTGKKVVLNARRAISKLTSKSRPRHYSGPIGSHNDWAGLPLKSFNVTGYKPVKTEGLYTLVHAKDFVGESSQVGYQQVGEGFATFTSTQLQGATTANVNSYLTAWGTDPFLLNPYSESVTNAIYTPASATIVSSDKCLIKHVDCKMQIVSLTPIAMKVEIYWLLCNLNSSDSPKQAWTDTLFESAYLQGLTGAGPTTTAGTAATLGFEAYTLPGAGLPKNYHKRWKTLHKDQFMLQPGDNMQMTRRFMYNRVITRGLANEMVNLYQKGLSLQPIVVVNGALVGLGADGESFPPTNIDRVSFGRTKIGLIQTDTIVFGALPATRYEIKRNEIGFVQGNSANATAIIDADDEEISAIPIG